MLVAFVQIQVSSGDNTVATSDMTNRAIIKLLSMVAKNQTAAAKTVAAERDWIVYAMHISMQCILRLINKPRIVSSTRRK
jgi:hypothetical protein